MRTTLQNLLPADVWDSCISTDTQDKLQALYDAMMLASDEDAEKVLVLDNPALANLMRPAGSPAAISTAMRKAFYKTVWRRVKSLACYDDVLSPYEVKICTGEANAMLAMVDTIVTDSSFGDEIDKFFEGGVSTMRIDDIAYEIIYKDICGQVDYDDDDYDDYD